MRIFLDDVRQPQQCLSYMHRRIGANNPDYMLDWIIVRDYYSFVEVVQMNILEITHISLDHDLADVHYDYMTQKESFAYHEKTGYDAAKWLIEYYRKSAVKLPIIWLHTMNNVGLERMKNLFNNRRS